MALIPVVIDYETFWSTTHSLTKMNPIDYVMHPETEIISVAVKVGKYPSDVVFGEDKVKAALNKIDWSDKIAIGHNMAGFDAMILAWRCGIHPKMWACTQAMARPHFAKTVGLSLAKLVDHYELGKKDQTALFLTRGKHLKDFTPDEIKAMAIYNKADTDQCYALFQRLGKLTSAKEMVQIDHTIRMLVNPAFTVDPGLLRAALMEEQERKRVVLTELAGMLYSAEQLVEARLERDVPAEELVREAMASPAKFSEILTARNVPVPMKPSPTDPSREIPALAKTDQAFLDLQEHDDPVVAAAAAARLDVKSTLLESRIQSFLSASVAAAGRLPIPLVYYGAHTGRWSGWGYNPQNLPRIYRDKAGNIIPSRTNVLRLCMKAPKGYRVVVSDLSGIEMRVNHFLWKVASSMKLFTDDPENADLYRNFAASLYNVVEEEVIKQQRQIGKVAHLGLGFHAGWSTFIRIAKNMGGVDMEEDEARAVVQKWRLDYIDIVRGWKKCENALEYASNGQKVAIDPWEMCHTTQSGIMLPSGRKIDYPNLRRGEHNGRAVWKFGDGRHLSFLSGGKVDENLVQAIARDILAENSAEITRQTGIYPALLVHDERVDIVKENKAEEHLATMNEIMRTPPKWWPELAVWSEGSHGESYGDAK